MLSSPTRTDFAGTDGAFWVFLSYVLFKVLTLIPTLNKKDLFVLELFPKQVFVAVAVQ